MKTIVWWAYETSAFPQLRPRITRRTRHQRKIQWIPTLKQTAGTIWSIWTCWSTRCGPQWFTISSYKYGKETIVEKKKPRELQRTIKAVRLSHEKCIAYRNRRRKILSLPNKDAILNILILDENQVEFNKPLQEKWMNHLLQWFLRHSEI